MIWSGQRPPRAKKDADRLPAKVLPPFYAKISTINRREVQKQVCYWLLSMVALWSRCSSIFLVMLQPQMSSKDTVELRVFAKEPKQVKHRESNWQRLNFFETDLSLSNASSQTALTRSVNSSFPSICVKPVS